jgi:hypothetical protein
MQCYKQGVPAIIPRQGSGICQFTPSDIMIVGGFNGKFVTDFYTFTIDSQGNPTNGTQYRRQPGDPNLFPFQVPTIGNSQTQQAITVDWSAMVLHRFQNGVWTQEKSVKFEGR